MTAELDALVAEWRAGLEGVTPGPWHSEYRPWATGRMRFLKAGKHTIGRVESTENIGCRGDSDANLEHVARCHPGNISALLDALEAERSKRVRLEEALRKSFCPRPCNNRPDYFEVGQCVDAGECGCSIGGPLSHSSSKGESDG